MTTHPIYREVRTPSKDVVIGGRTFTIHMHKSSAGSQNVLAAASTLGEPITEFISDNIEPLMAFYRKRDATKKVMVELGTEEHEADADLAQELLELLGKTKANVRELAMLFIKNLASDMSNKAFTDSFAFTLLDGEWLVGEHYENAFAGRLKDQLKLIYQIWLFNGWFDFLSLASDSDDKDEPTEA